MEAEETALIVKEATRPVGPDLVAALCAANLTLSLNVSNWTSERNLYFLQDTATDGTFTCLLTILLLAGVGYCFVRLARRSRRSTSVIAPIAVLVSLFALNQFRNAIGIPIPSLRPIQILIALLGLAFVFASLRWPVQTARIIHRTFTWAIAFVPFTVGTLLLHGFSGARPMNAIREVTGSAKPPVLLLVFDELDEGWLFDHRPADLKLPNFDALKATSTTFRMIQRPGPETLLSLPAITLGRTIKAANVTSRNDLRLTFSDDSQAIWSQTPSIFSDFQSRGYRVAINGYYHNYRGVFGRKIPSIETWSYGIEGFWPTFELQFWLLLPPTVRESLMKRVGAASPMNRAASAEHLVRLQRQSDSLHLLITGSAVDFIFCHVRVPHGPWLQDYRTGNLGPTSDELGYFGNLQFADRFLKRVVSDLVTTKRWDQATVVVTSDHNLRGSVRGQPLNSLVPLLVKLPGQRSSVECSRPGQAIRVRELLDSIAQHRTTTPTQAIQIIANGPRR